MLKLFLYKGKNSKFAPYYVGSVLKSEKKF